MTNRQFAVAAIGVDRPGIVAAVTHSLLEAGCSIDDSSMTILGGQFAMLLLVSGPSELKDLDAALGSVRNDFGLMLEVRDAGLATPIDVETRKYVVAAYGPDRKGLVRALAEVLSHVGANIEDFGSRVAGDGLFSMWFNIVLPSGIDPDALTARLRDSVGDGKLDVSIHEVDDEAL